MVHIGIIPDGNRRWLKKNNMELKNAVSIWTSKMLELLLKILDNKNLKDKKYKKLKKINEVSLYICSIDNLNRNDDTIKYILEFIENVYNLIFKKRSDIYDLNDIQYKKIEYYLSNININVIGEIELFPKKTQEILKDIKRTNQNNKFTLNLAIGYDYNNDLKNYKDNDLVNYDRNQSNIDILFRSGGEKRVSGFFPTKILYSELFFYNKLWPDITLDDINKVIKKFLKRDRRFGK